MSGDSPHAREQAQAPSDDVAVVIGNVENKGEDERQGAKGEERNGKSGGGDDDADDDDPDANCPICQYVGAGPCRDPHSLWSSCRKQHREDFVDACKPLFVQFFRCMTATEESREYHGPLLAAFGAPPPPAAAAAAAAAEGKAAGGGGGTGGEAAGGEAIGGEAAGGEAAGKAGGQGGGGSAQTT